MTLDVDYGPGTADSPAIRATELVKTFGSIRAVDGVSLELAPGRIYGFLGPERVRQDDAHPAPHRSGPSDPRAGRDPRRRDAVPADARPGSAT